MIFLTVGDTCNCYVAIPDLEEVGEVREPKQTQHRSSYRFNFEHATTLRDVVKSTINALQQKEHLIG